MRSTREKGQGRGIGGHGVWTRGRDGELIERREDRGGDTEKGQVGEYDDLQASKGLSEEGNKNEGERRD